MRLGSEAIAGICTAVEGWAADIGAKKRTERIDLHLELDERIEVPSSRCARRNLRQALPFHAVTCSRGPQSISVGACSVCPVLSTDATAHRCRSLHPDGMRGTVQALIGDRMRECYRTPAGKQERQAQVGPLRQEVRDAFVGETTTTTSSSSSSSHVNGAAAGGGSNGTAPAAAYTDSDLSVALKARRAQLQHVLTSGRSCRVPGSMN